MEQNHLDRDLDGDHNRYLDGDCGLADALVYTGHSLFNITKERHDCVHCSAIV